MIFNLILIWNFFFSIMVIFCRSSLYSIISLIFLILGCCFIFFTLQVEFLTFILLLIYIGALSVLFLFVVMMLKLDQSEKRTNHNFSLFLRIYLNYLLLSLKLSCFIFYFNKKLCFSLNLFSFEFFFHNKDINNSSYFLLVNKNDNNIFLSLFNQKYVFFIIIGFTLLISMVGSIAMCLIKK